MYLYVYVYIHIYIRILTYYKFKFIMQMRLIEIRNSQLVQNLIEFMAMRFEQQKSTNKNKQITQSHSGKPFCW